MITMNQPLAVAPPVSSAVLAPRDVGPVPSLADPQAPLMPRGYRLMADSATPWLIPARFNSPDCLVAPYLDGLYEWQPRQIARFPLAVKVPITVFGDPAAVVADVETGNMGPDQFVTWLRERIEAGESYHALYSSKDEKPLVDQAVIAAGMSPDIYGWWAADPTGAPHQVPGAVAVQFGWWAGWDGSAVWSAAWHPAQAA